MGPGDLTPPKKREVPLEFTAPGPCRGAAQCSVRGGAGCIEMKDVEEAAFRSGSSRCKGPVAGMGMALEGSGGTWYGWRTCKRQRDVVGKVG